MIDHKFVATHRYSQAPHSQLGAGFDGGGSWATAEVITAAAKKVAKDPDVRDKKLSRVFIVMYYITSCRNLYALSVIRLLLAWPEGIKPPS